jgi:hypothetical protein
MMTPTLAFGAYLDEFVGHGRFLVVRCDEISDYSEPAAPIG